MVCRVRMINAGSERVFFFFVIVIVISGLFRGGGEDPGFVCLGALLQDYRAGA